MPETLTHSINGESASSSGGIRKSSCGAREPGFAAVEFYTQTNTAYFGG